MITYSHSGKAEIESCSAGRTTEFAKRKGQLRASTMLRKVGEQTYP